MYDVVAVRHVRDYILWIRFEDGAEGEVDLSESLRGPVFDPLREVSYFAKARVEPELGTVVWPNGADIAPETLYERVRVAV